MVFSSVETREDFHRVYDLPLFLRLLAFSLLGFLEIKKTSLNDKLLPPYPLIDACVVEFDDLVLQLYVLLCVIIKVFQISKKSISITIVFLIEISSLRHVADDLI